MENERNLKEERDKIVLGLEESYRRFVLLKREKNRPIAVSRNGEIVEINANELQPTTKYLRKVH